MSPRRTTSPSLPRSGLVRDLHISRRARERYGVPRALLSLRGTVLLADLSAAQSLAHGMNQVRDVQRFPQLAVKTGELYAAGLLHEAMHLLLDAYLASLPEPPFPRVLQRLASGVGSEALELSQQGFVDAFPAPEVASGHRSIEAHLEGDTAGTPNRQVVLEEMLLLRLSNENPALERLRELFDDRELAQTSRYLAVVEAFEGALDGEPGFGGGERLSELLRAPMRASPTSLAGQLDYVRVRWRGLLGDRLAGVLDRMLTSLDVLREENRPGFAGPGPSLVPDAAALRGVGRVEYERFSSDLSWMPRVVLLAKSTYVWLDQLSKRYGRSIATLDGVPDEELDDIAAAGFTGLWLIGLWERSEASRRIKHLRGQPDAVASAYALFDYRLADDLGGEAAYRDLRNRAWARGVRLASDMVPNHVGIDGRWVVEHPERFLQLDEAPYPGYTFDGPDLSSDDRVGVFIEDHYYDSSDAAVVFKRLDRETGEARYIYHGNDGTSMPWNDTAQIDYLDPEAREAVIQTILEVARRFPIIRFDAAMTLASQHIQRLWYPAPGSGGAIPSRAQYGAMSTEEFERRMGGEFWREVVDRVAQEVPETLLLAEAFWMMEGYFVRTLGMHRVYNSAFMHMLKQERNGDYRQLIKNVLEFDPQILKRYVNFMNNPDEEAAVAQFGKDGKYFGVAVVMSTLPGLPMFGHGQVEGLREKYGMEYRRPKLDEQPDPYLVERHRREIFPLLHRREQFAEVENFLLYDLFTSEGYVNEDVYAYSNRVGEQASLVLFHNRFADVRGWLRRSAAFLDKAGSELRRRDLFDGLGLEGGSDRFVIVREHMSGSERLLRSERIRHEGLFVELGAFEYRVYLDVREVRDSDGELALLETELGRASVPSIELARLDLRFRPLHHGLAAVLDALPAAGGGAPAAEPGSAADLAERLLELSNQLMVEPLPDDADAALDARAGGDSRAGGASAVAVAGEDSAEASSDDEPLPAVVPLAAGDEVGADGVRAAAATPPGAARPFEERAEALAAEAFASPASAAAAVLAGLEVGLDDIDRFRLVPFLTRRWQGLVDDPAAEAELVPLLVAVRSLAGERLGPEAIFRHLGELPALATALAVNRYDGLRWFVAERFERMAVALAPLLRPVASGPDPLEHLRRIAERTGYSFDQLAGAAAASEPVDTENGAPGVAGDPEE